MGVAVVLHDETMIIKPLELLEFFRSYEFLERYTLVLYCRRGGQVFPIGPASHACGELVNDLKCGELCRAAFENAVSGCLGRNKPAVFRCRSGLLNFAVPLLPGGLVSYCLIGGGLREKSVDLTLMESLARSCNINAFALLEKLDELPFATLADVKKAAARVFRIVSSFHRENLHSRLLDRSIDRLNAVSAVSVQVDRSGTVEEAIELLNEALGILFDIPRIAIVLRSDDGGDCSIRAASGVPAGITFATGYDIRELFRDDGCKDIILTGKEMESLFPGIGSGSVVCLPIQSSEELLGLVALFDAELHQRDVRLVELLIGRLSSKLMLAEKKENEPREGYLTGKLLLLMDAISSTENKEELFGTILDAAVELLQASTGSLMVVDEDGRSLRIKAAIGMSPRLARSMKLEIGSGIAGKVVASGQPMLVNDIEEDKRVGIRNRHRFKTKSFISAPLKVRGNTMGVLNLSDRKDGDSFTKHDMGLLNSLLNQAALVLERVESDEKADMLEQISVTDPLTGLFNQRYLELRLEEELSRCRRREEKLAVMFVGLDEFDVYNDLVGGGNSDEALKKCASLLKASSRQMDTVTRVSRGKFCLITPGASAGESLIVAERIRIKIEGTAFPGEENLISGRLTASAGVSLFPENGASAEELLRTAGAALERAKASGGNRVVHFTAGATGGSKVVPINSAARQ
jgi:diguanylate cyclase (GGDEF)-like protein